MSANFRSQAPIGYWLKHTDEVITRHVNQVLSSQGLTRFHWQVLNIVSEAGVINKEQVFETMQTFVDKAGLEAIIDEFVKRGWMVCQEQGQNGAAQLELTGAGKDGHRQILSLQSEVRKRAVEGISAEEFATVIRVLQQITKNLEPDEA